MKINLFFCLFLPAILFGQIEIKLPENVQVQVDDLSLHFNEDWFDSLHYEADQNIFLYRIATCLKRNYKITTKIQLPQTLKINQVIRQVILYYSLLDTEKEKIKENLWIYPLFQDLNNSASIKCSYADNIYNFKIINWETIPVPAEPTPEEKHLYNQILKTKMEQHLNFKSSSKVLFQEFAQISSIPVKKVERVYQKVYLWKNSKLYK